MRLITWTLSVLLSSTFFYEGKAQEIPDSLVNRSLPKTTRLLELGLSANAYRGDLGNYENWSAVFHAGLRFNQTRRINHRIGIHSGFVTGNDRFYRFEGDPNSSPNTFFRTNILGLTYEMEINLYYRRNFRVYLSPGIGFLRYQVKNSEGENLSDLVNTRPDNENYGNFALQLPTGLGLMYLFKNGYGLGFYAGFMNIQSDFLDNISLWGNASGNDNILRTRISFLIPLKREALRFKYPVSNDPYKLKPWDLP